MIQDGDHLLCVLRYIEANPVRAKLVPAADEYRWSSYAAHGLGKVDELLDPLPDYEATAGYPAVRRRRWAAYVHQTPPDAEIRSTGRSNESGLPFGQSKWVNRLAKKLNLDLTIRPRGRPRKQVVSIK